MDEVERVARAIERTRLRYILTDEDCRTAARAALAAMPIASDDGKLREALEVVAGGSPDVSDTAIIVGNGASTVLRQVRHALAASTPALPRDVARLVRAAREVAFGGYFDGGCEHAQARLSELDAASEAFASRLDWDEAPPALASTDEVGGE